MFKRALGSFLVAILTTLVMTPMGRAQSKTPSKSPSAQAKPSAKSPAKSAPGGAAQRGWLEGIPAGRTRVIDLAYAINDHLPLWPGEARGFRAETAATVEKEGYFTRSFWMLEHYGTHLDAPIHFPPGKTPVDQIPAQRLFGPAVVVDVHEEVARDPDYRLTLEPLVKWEKEHGRIPEGSIVLLRTSWAKRWPDAQRYRNKDGKGVMHFPGYSTEAVVRLIERKVSGIGIDTMSVDFGPSKNFPAHKLALGAGLYHLENLADMGALPEAGAFLIVAPIKLEGGTGGPCRVFAILPAE